jgi:hypothetical protein
MASPCVVGVAPIAKLWLVIRRELQKYGKNSV